MGIPLSSLSIFLDASFLIAVCSSTRTVKLYSVEYIHIYMHFFVFLVLDSIYVQLHVNVVLLAHFSKMGPTSLAQLGCFFLKNSEYWSHLRPSRWSVFSSGTSMTYTSYFTL